MKQLKTVVLCLLVCLLFGCERPNAKSVRSMDWFDVYKHDYTGVTEAVEAIKNNMVFFKVGDKCFGAVFYMSNGFTHVSITQVTGCPEFGTQ
jgi:hypothetical protein